MAKVLVDEAHGTHLYFEKIFQFVRWMQEQIWPHLHAQIRRKPDAKLHPF